MGLAGTGPRLRPASRTIRDAIGKPTRGSVWYINTAMGGVKLDGESRVSDRLRNLVLGLLMLGAVASNGAANIHDATEIGNLEQRVGRIERVYEASHHISGALVTDVDEAARVQIYRWKPERCVCDLLREDGAILRSKVCAVDRVCDDLAIEACVVLNGDKWRCHGP